jgi:AcrR family transcriptional regulator
MISNHHSPTSPVETVKRGRRARKKEQTRQLIVDTASRLFAERGFDHVTLAEIAETADVSAGTLFNYFPHKEDLVLGGMETFQQQLLGAIRERAPGDTILAAFRRFVLQPRQPRGMLGSCDPAARERLTTMSRIMVQSPTLLAHENQLFERCTDALAELIAQETGKAADAIEPWVLANALIGIHRALLRHTRREILAGTDHQRIRRTLRTHGNRALDLLEHGAANSLDGKDTPATPT